MNTFSSFFKEKIALIHKSLPTSILRFTDPSLPDNQTPLTYLSFVSIEEVSRTIRSLPNKSSSLELIPTFTLKRFSHFFAPIISKLTNLSFSQAIFPASFKTAQVLPLLKKGNLDSTIPSNYRPICNLSTISKIIERLVHSRITSHVSSSPNFNPFQSAYRKHHSTETTLLRITDSLRNICATGHAAVLVSLDFSAAFDTLDHNILIDILNRHSIFLTSLLLGFALTSLNVLSSLKWTISFLLLHHSTQACRRVPFWDQSSSLFIHHPCVALLYSTTSFFTSSLMTSLFSPESLTQILAPLSLNYSVVFPL